MYLKTFLMLILVKQVAGAKILALMVVASHSHHLWNSKYLKALSDRGHEIVYFSVDEFKNPPKNIKSIVIEDFYEAAYGDVDFADVTGAGPYAYTYLLHKWEDLEHSVHSRSKGMQELKDLLKKEKFDLILHDLGSSPYLLGVVDVVGRPPVVGITAFGVPTWALEILGNPMTYSSKPHFFVQYSNRMDILQRANNYFLHLFSFAVRWFFMRKQNKYSKECFGENVRPLNQILDDINIIMVNINHGFDYPFPMVPGLVPVGGLHLEKPKPLPLGLQTYLDESKDGVIYFSLGSNLQSSKLNKNKVDILVEAFKLLSPVRVLWKWESDFLPEKPENVRIEKWLPQNDILAHPNVRIFFTHCGLLSTQEAFYHGKPIVGMPIFLDQYINLQKSLERGLGEHLTFASLTTDDVVRTIRKVLLDSRYEEKARNISVLFKDQIVNPLETAIYWTEYAIKHKGAPHLRHSARDLTWYQNWILDILLITFSVICLLSLFVWKACILISSVFFAKPEPKLKNN